VVKFTRSTNVRVFENVIERNVCPLFTGELLVSSYYGAVLTVDETERCGYF
jgi:hypothetical protein